jgi:hypothetical protein
MRHATLALSLAMLVAACGSNGNGNGTGGNGSPDMAVAPDLAPPPAAQLSCSGVLQCINKATSQAEFTACTGNVKPASKPKFNAFFQCVVGQCQSAGPDAGTTACSSQGECILCVQTGTSPTGKTITDPQSGQAVPCLNDPMATTPVSSDPKCGQCVDPLSACLADT